MTEKLFSLALELQSLAQAGLFYGKDIFDLERYERIKDISLEILSNKTSYSLERVSDLFLTEKGYQTPKVDVRSAVFQEDTILLVQEKTGLWSLPGGWCDILLTPTENAIKEVKEEAGLDVKIDKLVAVLDMAKHHQKKNIFSVYKLFFTCEVLGGEFISNSETLASRYFKLTELPELAESKTTVEEIEMCFDAYQNSDWKVVVD
ncbi:NUDIX domain-containing protein [Granulicatella sp. zg-ZJ]|uniref:NUDIX hydrolase N-terminal domain-containing protein n=1 Tax=Granulicatella sp. zg-ZJ TaxID=2678504 RepID=UPI0013D706CC|nr:NUDIX hydrolase [Granulicatella sp. zg-ZJ]NEW62245.1 NUDIX domain-containing protein [Granulicatella sp. zg-ZJ]